MGDTFGRTCLPWLSTADQERTFAPHGFQTIFQCTKISFVSLVPLDAVRLSNGICFAYFCVCYQHPKMSVVFLFLSFFVKVPIPQDKKTRGILDLTSLEKSW